MAGERILVVDDEAVLRKLLADMLALEDFDVVTAEDADSAVKLLSKRRFDAAILDLMMPRVTGIELLEKIREIDKELPVIILTAYGSKESAIKALRLGAHDYLEKPPERERLIHTIRKGIERRKLREENTSLMRELQERAERLKLISQMGAAIASSLDMNNVISMALGMGKRAVGAKTCFMFLVDDDKNKLTCRAIVGVGDSKDSEKAGADKSASLHLPVCFQEIAETTLQKRDIIFIEAKKDPRFLPLNTGGWDVNSLLSVPLLLREKVLGVIQVIDKVDGKKFTKADGVFIKLTANFVSVALENAVLTEKLNKSMAQLADYSRTLEEKVKERTKELIDANSALEKMNKSLLQMQEKIIQTEKLASLGELSAGIAHEINNPLGYINSNLNSMGDYLKGLIKLLSENEKLGRKLLEVEDALPYELRDFLQNIQILKDEVEIEFIREDIFRLLEESKKGTAKIAKIVANLKKYSYTGDGQLNEKVNLNTVIEDAFSIVFNKLKYKADTELQLGDIPQILGNSLSLGQVFTNLLTNAADAIKKWGKITIATYAKDSKIYAIVSDTGCGIPQENIKKIFDPFFTTKKIGEGTGLGLSVSYGIVQKHGGEIEVESEVGKGTTFRVILPIASAMAGDKTPTKE